MIEAILELNTPKGCVLRSLRERPGLVRVLSLRPLAGEKVGHLIEINADQKSVRRTLGRFRDNIAEVVVDLPFRDNRTNMALLSSKACEAYRLLLESDAFLLSEEARDSYKVRWNLVCRDRSCLQVVLQKLQSHGCDPKIVNISRINRRPMLTPRQEETIRTAMERGYFDFPKKVHMRELSRILRASQSTVSEVLRRAEKRIISDYSKVTGFRSTSARFEPFEE